MAWQTISALSLLALLASASPVPASHAVHETRGEVPSRWASKGRVAANAILPVRIGLAQTNLDKGPDYLMDVSDPASPNYGKHWTREQVTAAFKPTDETTKAVVDWLKGAGINDITLSENKAWLAFNIPASQAESLLHAEYESFEDAHTGRVEASTERYHVPKAIQHHIDYVTPGVKLLAPNAPARKAIRKQTKVRRSVDSLKPGLNQGTKNCDQLITPDCIAALYDIPKATLKPNPKNILGIYEAESQRWDPADLNLFFANFTAGAIPQGTKPINYAVDGGESETPLHYVSPINGGEIMLDLDIAYPIVYPQKIGMWDENDPYYQRTLNFQDTTFFGFNQVLDAIDGSYCTYSAYGEKGDDPNLDPKYPNPEPVGGYNGTLECGVFKPPYVFSSSYGGQENIVPMAYQMRQCNEWLKLGLMGTSVLFASGDNGVSGVPNAKLSKTGCIGDGLKAFNPGWPNTCPWLTNVGATEILPGHNVHESQPESAVEDLDPKNPLNDYTSGGGFSNLYPIPKYQQTAVAEYFAKHNPPYQYYSKLAVVKPNPALLNVSQLQGGNSKALYNRIGRGFPDVAANGFLGAVVLHGNFTPEGGTSMAAPLFASVINRIVEERLAKGKKPLGFLNPTLYAHPQILNDIVNGSNPGCGTNGFTTAPGWDPVSGLGTPNYPRMSSLFLSLP